MTYYPKEFIQTAEGLLFAVVAEGIEDGKVRCFLRYIYKNQKWHKLKTAEANQLINTWFSHYRFYSSEFDSSLHGVQPNHIITHYDPYHYCQQTLAVTQQLDDIQKDCLALYTLFEQEGVKIDDIGVTGSLLVNLQKKSSDIDLVCCTTHTFQACRAALQSLILKNKLQMLSIQDWQDAYHRRECELSFDEYVWHEKRKYNKGLVNGRKFDLSLVTKDVMKHDTKKTYQKKELMTLRAKVIEDVNAFSYPSELQLDHPTIKTVVSFSATYVGQAQKDEIIDMTGFIEQDNHGTQRIVVGLDREAKGHYIKVLKL